VTLQKLFTNISVGGTFAGIIVAGMLISSNSGQAANDNNAEQDQKLKIQIGFQVAPVMLNLAGKDRNLVGLGSYIVNVQAECNGCHSHGPQTQFATNGNPYQFLPPSLTVHQTEVINTATYLGGGRDFGAYPSPASALHIVSRNLTPDVTGRPIGGATFAEFVQIMRTGKDFDTDVHPNCPANAPKCMPYPFDGGLLQIMPWPAFRNMTDHDLQAIYEYLSAIPCIDTVDANNPQLHNVCPVAH